MASKEDNHPDIKRRLLWPAERANTSFGPASVRPGAGGCCSRRHCVNIRLSISFIRSLLIEGRVTRSRNTDLCKQPVSWHQARQPSKQPWQPPCLWPLGNVLACMQRPAGAWWPRRGCRPGRCTAGTSLARALRSTSRSRGTKPITPSEYARRRALWRASARRRRAGRRRRRACRARRCDVAPPAGCSSCRRPLARS